MTTFRSRLLEAMEKAEFGRGDLHWWFEYPRPTIRAWFEVNREDYNPLDSGHPQRGRRTMRLLKLLEYAVQKKVGLPLPDTMSSRERPRRIMEIRRELDARLPADYSARGRA